ncbi:MAG TPA: hypothetical protein VEO54_21845 [Thermoanaerobaculia bacterium]|nr:hypothetical protein [Thermoanaerobaculia bacterium]
MTTIPDSPTPHEDNAQAIRAELQRLLGGMRGITLLTPERRRQLAVAGHVDEDFLRSMALLLDAQPDIAATIQLTGADIREHLSYSGSYQGVGEEMRLNGRRVDDSLFAERASVGERALRGLKIARSMNTPAGRESLVPHLDAIDREFARGRRRRPVAVKKTDDVAAAKKSEVKP